MESELLSLIANIFVVLVSLLGYIIQRKSYKNTLNEQQIKNQEREEKYRHVLLQNIRERANFKPYFVIDTNSIILEKEETLKIPIKLTNIGKESAVQVYIVCEKLDSMFYSCNNSNISHDVADYLSKTYAQSGDIIEFSIACKKHLEGCQIGFKIGFSDLVGREYEQEFRFEYCLKFTHELSMRNTCEFPVCTREAK